MRAASILRIWLSAVLLTIYVTFVLTVTFTPQPIDRPFRGDLDRIIEELHERGLPAWFGYDQFEFLANVAMFVPVGLLVVILLPRRGWWLVLLVGPAFAGLIELVQGTFLPERYSSVGDLLANSLGTIVGAVLGTTFRAIVAWRDALILAEREALGVSRGMTVGAP